MDALCLLDLLVIRVTVKKGAFYEGNNGEDSVQLDRIVGKLHRANVLATEPSTRAAGP